jgi:hypothetical protein
MIRSTGFPFTLCSGKYTKCVSGSTATVWAWGIESRPTALSDLPFS